MKVRWQKTRSGNLNLAGKLDTKVLWQKIRQICIIYTCGFRLNNLRVFSMNSKDMLSKALEKSICSMRPGRLLDFACWKRSKVFLVMSPMNLFGR